MLTKICLLARSAEAVADVKGEGYLLLYCSRLGKKFADADADADAADALAIAICHAHRVNAAGVLYRASA